MILRAGAVLPKSISTACTPAAEACPALLLREVPAAGPCTRKLVYADARCVWH